MLTQDTSHGKLADSKKLGAKERALLMGLRQTLIMALGLVEDYLGLERSIVSKRKRDKNVTRT